MVGPPYWLHLVTGGIGTNYTCSVFPSSTLLVSFWCTLLVDPIRGQVRKGKMGLSDCQSQHHGIEGKTWSQSPLIFFNYHLLFPKAHILTKNATASFLDAMHFFRNITNTEITVNSAKFTF